MDIIEGAVKAHLLGAAANGVPWRNLPVQPLSEADDEMTSVLIVPVHPKDVETALERIEAALADSG